MAGLAAITTAAEAGNPTAAAGLTQAAGRRRVDPATVPGATTAAMDVLGRRFHDGATHVPRCSSRHAP